PARGGVLPPRRVSAPRQVGVIRVVGNQLDAHALAPPLFRCDNSSDPGRRARRLPPQCTPPAGEPDSARPWSFREANGLTLSCQRPSQGWLRAYRKENNPSPRARHGPARPAAFDHTDAAAPETGMLRAQRLTALLAAALALLLSGAPAPAASSAAQYRTAWL